MQIFAKTSVDEQQFAAKSQYIHNEFSDYSCDGLEIHLQTPEDIDNLARHKEWFKDVRVIHMPMRNNADGILCLEDINNPALTGQFQDLFYLAQKIYEHNGGIHRVGIVLHIRAKDSLSIDVIRILQRILRDLEIDIYVENLVESVNTYTQQDSLISSLKLGTRYDKIYPCVDICHTVMNWNKMAENVSDDTYWDFLKHYFYLFSKYQGGLIHLASIRGNGYGVRNHGVPFDPSNKFDVFLMENIVDLYNSMCSPYNLPVTLEVSEPTPEDYIKGQGYINTCILLKKSISKHIDTHDIINICTTNKDEDILYRKVLKNQLPDVEVPAENDIEQANFTDILQGVQDEN